MTIVSTQAHEIKYFETFSIGSKMLIDIIASNSQKMTFTEIESLIMRARANEEDEKIRKDAAIEYFSYVIDTLVSVIQKEKDTVREKTLFVSGGVFSSPWMKNLFFEKLESVVGNHPSNFHLSELLPKEDKNPEQLITS